MSERVMRIWIGLFVFGSLLLLAWLIILFGSARTSSRARPSTR